LQVLSETNGTVRCHTAYNCTEACPRDIHITEAIGELKLAMVTGSLK
jgi:succinate dehydrogenase / fumarate reductase iron-sulfur subunit